MTMNLIKLRELDGWSKNHKNFNELPENKPAEVEQTEQFNRFNKLYQDGQVNLAAAIPLAPMAIAPLAKAFGISTAGLEL